MSNDISVLLTTVANQTDAEQMSAMLIEQQLAACVQTIDVDSRFRWQGEVQKEHEVLLLIKTATNGVDMVTEAIREQHSYDVPEIIALPVAGGLSDYIKWVSAESQPTADAKTA
ncbi:MAG: divalent-cation tolerance protein CutA [Gammaproteobacteria bacterium]|nr:divalent-cation tolerance protein CutA [Gammaproteobacteria bacterium]